MKVNSISRVQTNEDGTSRVWLSLDLEKGEVITHESELKDSKIK